MRPHQTKDAADHGWLITISAEQIPLIQHRRAVRQTDAAQTLDRLRTQITGKNGPQRWARRCRGENSALGGAASAR